MIRTQTFAFLVLALSILGSIRVRAQEDSLLNVIKSSSSDAEKLNAYVELVRALEVEAPERAIAEGKKGMELGRNSENHPLIAELLTNMAFVHIIHEENDAAIPYLELAASKWQQAGDSSRLAKNYANLGIISRKLGDYSTALKYQLQGLRLYEDLEDSAHVVSTLVSIGAIYTWQQLLDQAEENIQRAYDLSIEMQDPSSIAATANSFGNLFLETENFTQAAKYFEESLATFKILEDPYHEAKVSTNLGIVYRNLSEYDKAEACMLSSSEFFKNNRAPVESATVLINLSKVYQLQEKPEKAIQVAKEAIAVFSEHQSLTELKVAHENLSGYYESTGENQLALDHHKKYMLLKDSLLNEEIAMQINELNTEYETERKEKEILLLTRENELQEKQTLLIVSGFMIVLVIGIGFFIYFNQRRRHESRLAQSKLAQNLKEIDILREKIAEGTTQYASPHEFSVKPDEVNKYLQDPLTERELQVLYLLAEGLPNKEIAERSFISINTVKFHLQKIYVKLGVNNRTQAVNEMAKLKQRLR